MLMDEPVPGSMLAAGLSEGDEDDAVAEGFWGAPLRGVRLRWLAGVALAFLLAFWVHAKLRGERVARRCQECGTPYCTHCHSDFRERTYCAPCTPVFGLICVRIGTPAVTVNALASVRTCAPVVTVTVRGPGTAPAAIANVAVSCVALVTTVVAVMPTPKLAVVVPFTQAVNCPLTVTARLVAP